MCRQAAEQGLGPAWGQVTEMGCGKGRVGQAVAATGKRLCCRSINSMDGSSGLEPRDDLRTPEGWDVVRRTDPCQVNNSAGWLRQEAGKRLQAHRQPVKGRRDEGWQWVLGHPPMERMVGKQRYVGLPTQSICT